MLARVKKALTNRGRKIIEILRNDGGWLTRSALADALGMDGLSHHDRDILARLDKAGYIEVDSRMRKVGSLFAEYIYRATDKPVDD